WRNLQNTPQTYPPSAHQHASSDIPELASQLDTLVKKTGSLMTGSLQSQGTLIGDSHRNHTRCHAIHNGCRTWHDLGDLPVAHRRRATPH
ncbi:hypothetical protein C5H19_08605, partial [Xylella fastidiosa]